jgi:putative FmdB family regulatory protein
MPIYEYLCPTCNRVYSFLSQRPEVERRPSCPRCGNTDLKKQVSRFAVVRGGGSPQKGPEEPGDRPPGPGGAPEQEPNPLDDPRVERELMRLVQDAEHMDENDPRQMGRFMRRMSEVTGEKLDEEMEEAVRRLESGEDVERVEEDLGGALGGGEEGEYGGYGPTYDEGLYSM